MLKVLKTIKSVHCLCFSYFILDVFSSIPDEPSSPSHQAMCSFDLGELHGDALRWFKTPLSMLSVGREIHI